MSPFVARPTPEAPWTSRAAPTPPKAQSYLRPLHAPTNPPSALLTMQAARSEGDSATGQALRPNWAVPEYRCSTCKGRRLCDFIDLYYDASKRRWNRSCEVCRVKRRGDARRLRMTRSKAQSAKRGRVRAQGDKAPGADAGKGVESVLNHSQRQTLKPELGDLPAAKRLRAPEVWSAPYSTRPHQGAAQGMQTPYAFNSTAYAAGSSVPAHYHAWLPFNMSPVWPPAYAMYPPQGYSFSPYHHQYMARFGYSPLLAQDRAHTSTISAAAIPANSSTAGLSPSLGADSPPYPQDSSRSRVDLAVAAAMASFGAPATTDSSQLATQAI